ncbi:DNA polymerase alpha subunit B [Mycena indigotica]|uniref:DNA polymerase alpha subunit B n=1 Tax=Mycena indigotica TaxID=2126181 RepID=A0A8H6W4R9_9AGAR|nr:DNA polymerase alpha subunit B [Mycena indigotica]KAF7299214.1 DNA polymerase alpha subunit B [Mycena indigotica]
MADDALAQEICSRFPEVASDASLVAECVTVCKNYALSPEDLQYKWEAHNFRPSATRSEISPYTLESLISLKQQIQRDRTINAIPKPAPRPTALVAALNRTGFRGRGAGSNVAKSSQVKVEPDAEGFAMIAGPSKVAFRGPPAAPAARKKRAYRYMLDKPSERGHVMDQRIEEYAERIREQYELNDIGDPSASTADEITVVGRIIHDDDAAEDTSKLGDTAIAIECACSIGGPRAPIRFEWDLKIRGGPKGNGAATFFPGALAAFRGKNGGADHFQVSEVLYLPPPPLQTEFKPEPHDPFSVLVACGPFTPDTDLGFKSWRALLQKLQEIKPDVVVLTGPFIDAQHPHIKSGEVDSTPASLFRTRFVDPLRSYLDSAPGSIAVVVPSVRDLVSSHAVFPQAELERELVKSDPRIHTVPNPAWFTLNGLSFSVTSADILFHLKRGEFTKRGAEIDPVEVSPDDACGDAIVGLCKHVLQQRSIYPVFPVPADLTNELVLDITHSGGLRLGPGMDGSSDVPPPDCSPDVLIVASRFKQFAKPVYETTAINPGFVYKGSYVVLEVGARTGEERPVLAPRVLKLE